MANILFTSIIYNFIFACIISGPCHSIQLTFVFIHLKLILNSSWFNVTQYNSTYGR